MYKYQVVALTFLTLALVGCGGTDIRDTITPPISKVTSRAAIKENDYIDWQVVNLSTYDGEAITQFPTHGGDYVQFDGANLEDTSGYQGYQIWTESTAESFNGGHCDFLPDDFIIRTYYGVNSQMRLIFDSPISAVGSQFQPRGGNHFSVVGMAYDSKGNLIGQASGSFSVKGLKDGSARFFGIKSRTKNIASVIFTINDDSDLPTDEKNEVWANRVSIHR